MTQPTKTSLQVESARTVVVELTFASRPESHAGEWDLRRIVPVLGFVTALTGAFYRTPRADTSATVSQAADALLDAQFELERRTRVQDSDFQDTTSPLPSWLPASESPPARGRARRSPHQRRRVVVESMSLGSPWFWRTKIHDADAVEQGAMAMAAVSGNLTSGKLQNALRRGGQALGETRALGATIAATRWEIESDGLAVHAQRSKELDHALAELQQPIDRLVRAGVLTPRQGSEVYRHQVQSLLRKMAPEAAAAIQRVINSSPPDSGPRLISASAKVEDDDEELLDPAIDAADAAAQIIEFDPSPRSDDERPPGD